jgi:hypothetical protein
MNRLALIAVFVAGLGVAGLGAAGIDAAAAQTFVPSGGSNAPPFTATLSNNTPLVFGMDAEDAARATKPCWPSATSAAAGCSSTKTGFICNSARAD